VNEYDRLPSRRVGFLWIIKLWIGRHFEVRPSELKRKRGFGTGKVGTSRAPVTGEYPKDICAIGLVK